MHDHLPMKVSKTDKKISYNQKLCHSLDEYVQILIVAIMKKFRF